MRRLQLLDRFVNSNFDALLSKIIQTISFKILTVAINDFSSQFGQLTDSFAKDGQGDIKWVWRLGQNFPLERFQVCFDQFRKMCSSIAMLKNNCIMCLL